MYFNKEDLNFLREYLSNTGKKDTDFDQANTLDGTEYFALVKNGNNYKITANLMKHFLSNGDVQTLGGIQVVDNYSDLNSISSKSYGNLVYVKNEDKYYSWSASNEWHQVLKVYVGTDKPVDKNVLWINTEDEATLSNADNEDITAIKQEIQVLTANQNKLLKLITFGVVPGNSTVSVRKDAMSEANPIEPVLDKDGNLTDNNVPDSDNSNKPDTTDYDYTVPTNNAKLDLAANFTKNKQNLTDGAMLFFTDKKIFKVYYQGGFYGSTASNSGGGSGGGLSLDDLYAADLEYLIFTDGTYNYKVKVLDNGDYVCSKFSRNPISMGSKDGKWGTYISQYLCINTVFCGGAGSEDCSCSHNFVELANASDNDINLNGIMLLYTDGTMYSSTSVGRKWSVLPLSGFIKAHSTFLIRGARCNTDKRSFIKIDDYDIAWNGDDGNPIQFKQGMSSFYLAVGSVSDSWVYDETGKLLAKDGLNTPWNKLITYTGYIDSCGFGTGAVAEKASPLVPDQNDSWDNCMFIRWYMFDTASQGNKAYASRSTSALWTYINMNTQEKYLGNSVQYYYPDYMKKSFSPKSSWKGKDFFTNKNRFNPAKPNVINITFGIQATSDTANNIKASRCFNWVSVGYYNEFLQYRKKGDTVWTKVYSITKDNAGNNTAISKYIQHYQRFRWSTSSGTWVTTHKVVLSGIFDKGTYEYRIGRDNDETYYSSIYEFTVHDNADISSFSFIQETDQQGFNWAEYQAWKRSAYFINKNEDNYDFTINTGDETQNGNRENEWIDYFDGRYLIDGKEEMFTIGNNDLCGHDATVLTNGNDATSKYNHINVLRYFTFEIDVNNSPEFVWNNVTYPIYSLYSFNYGIYHFISLNSETAIASSKTYIGYEDDSNHGDATYAQTCNAAIEDWFKKDLQIWKGIQSDPTGCSKAIVYMHENPFTIVTWQYMSGSSERAGSHLNTLDSRGLYRFSRLFKKYGIRLVMGGHKHTYAFTKPIYDAPAGYIKSDHTIDSTVDLMNTIDAPSSRVPVIQITNPSYIPSSDDNARYELVTKIDAPVYVTSQATGYKLVSNKELPSGNDYTIPWLFSYFKALSNSTSPKVNAAQYYPTYIRYDLSATEIKITSKQIYGIWNVDIHANKKSYDMNNQISDLNATPMTLSQISDADKTAYGITDNTTYTIEL